MLWLQFKRILKTVHITAFLCEFDVVSEIFSPTSGWSSYTRGYTLRSISLFYCVKQLVFYVVSIQISMRNVGRTDIRCWLHYVTVGPSPKYLTVDDSSWRCMNRQIFKICCHRPQFQLSWLRSSHFKMRNHHYKLGSSFPGNFPVNVVIGWSNHKKGTVLSFGSFFNQKWVFSPLQ